jgi:hypothetical protein
VDEIDDKRACAGDGCAGIEADAVKRTIPHFVYIIGNLEQVDVLTIVNAETDREPGNCLPLVLVLGNESFDGLPNARLFEEWKVLTKEKATVSNHLPDLICAVTVYFDGEVSEQEKIRSVRSKPNFVMESNSGSREVRELAEIHAELFKLCC